MVPIGPAGFHRNHAGTASGAVEGVRPARPPAAPEPGEAASGTGFRGVLEQVLAEREGLRFSAHARARLAERRIQLGEEGRQRLLGAVNRASGKGAREAVVVLDGVAYVVSVRNRTVITVVDGPRLKENIFTNIDSVVFA